MQTRWIKEKLFWYKPDDIYDDFFKAEFKLNKANEILIIKCFKSCYAY